MKKISFILSMIMLFLLPKTVFAERELVGATSVKDNMLYINGNSIPAAQLPNEFVYLPVDMLEYYGFDVFLKNEGNKKVYTVMRNEEKSFFPQGGYTANHYNDTNVFTTDAEVYIDSDIPANVFELENKTVLVQSDELAKYGSYYWDADTRTISIDFKNETLLPFNQPFHNVIGFDSKADVASGVLVDKHNNKGADIAPDDLKDWINVYWDFNYERIIAPMEAFSSYEYYIKVWSGDKSKSFTIYPNSGAIVGAFGEPCESHGEVKTNYIWYVPYVGNARNALYTANTKLTEKYLNEKSEEFAGHKRDLLSSDAIDIPSINLLNLNNASYWAKPEIQKAASCNLMIYELSNKYPDNITRLEFCKLAQRLIATEFYPNCDSRMGIWYAVDTIINEKGLRESYNNAAFTDCSDDVVKFLSACGIVNGMGDGAFAPEEYITREQAATILCRMAGFLGNKTMLKPSCNKMYDDENQISDWAKSSVASMKAMGIMQGIGESQFAPKGFYTVEQAILTMLRLYECV